MELLDTKMPNIGTVHWEDEDTGFDGDEKGHNPFADMLAQAPGGSEIREGTIVKGRVMRLTDDGIVGYGEVYASAVGPQAMEAALRNLMP